MDTPDAHISTDDAEKELDRELAGKPKKYIRTYAGDLETLRRGGVPDLAPLPEEPPPKSGALPPPAPAPEHPPAPAPSPREPRMPSLGAFHTIREPGHPLDLLAPRPPAPAPAAEAPPVPQPPAPVPSEGPTPIHTYAEDFTSRVKETNASPVTVLAAEQDAAPAPSAPEAPPRGAGAGLWYVAAGVLLLVAGAAGASVAYTRYRAETAPVAPAPVASAPIFVDERAQVSGAGAALAQAISDSLSHPPAAGAVRLLSLAGATTTGASVFSALALPAPDILLRNINASSSMAGIVNEAGAASPFFILSVASYRDTLAGMLSWEATMPRDLAPLFPPPAPAATSAATSAATTTNALPVNAPLSFRDEVVANHDVRVYGDAAGDSTLLYGYWDPSTLVIARDAAAFTELVNRLATSRAP